MPITTCRRGKGCAATFANPVEGPADYWLANASLYWRIREWLAWQNTFQVSTGQANNEELQTRFDTSFNFNF